MTNKKIKKPAKKKVLAPKAKKKIVIKKSVTKTSLNKEKKVGVVTHYFDKIKVAAIKLSDVLSVGDTVRIEGGESTDFKQKVASMELQGEKIKKGKKGQQIGIKIKEKARDGYRVFKL